MKLFAPTENGFGGVMFSNLPVCIPVSMFHFHVLPSTLQNADLLDEVRMFHKDELTLIHEAL